MTIKHCQGDLFEQDMPALAHGVNCQGVMGGGIAAQFRDRWPDMYQVYRAKCERGSLRLGDVFEWYTGGVGARSSEKIFNLVTQYNPGPDARPWAIAVSIGTMIRIAHKLNIKEIGMPMIGCGIGGLGPVQLWACLEPYQGAPVDLIVYEYKP